MLPSFLVKVPSKFQVFIWCQMWLEGFQYFPHKYVQVSSVTCQLKQLFSHFFNELESLSVFVAVSECVPVFRISSSILQRFFSAKVFLFLWQPRMRLTLLQHHFGNLVSCEVRSHVFYVVGALYLLSLSLYWPTYQQKLLVSCNSCSLWCCIVTF